MTENSAHTPESDSNWQSGTNEYADLKHEAIRSGRDLESYKRIFGEHFGTKEELILDVGAGDATMADEIEVLTDHRAQVIRFDRDYGDVAPEGEAPAVAGDATQMPFADQSIDRIVSHNMMYYLGRDKGAVAIGEMMRVLKEGGEAAIYPAKPFKNAGAEIGEKEKHAALDFPNLAFTRPQDFDTWDDSRKQTVYEELAKAVTGGKVATMLIHWGVAKAVQHKGTHRTIEGGSANSL